MEEIPGVQVKSQILPATLQVRSLLAQLARFGITGGCNAAIDILALNLLLWRFPAHDPNILIVYNIVAYLFGALNSYLLNKYWTFRRSGTVNSGELLRFLTINAIGISSNSFLFWVAVRLLHPSLANLLLLTNLSKISAIAGTAAISYLGMHLWVFKKSARSAKGHLMAYMDLPEYNHQSSAPDSLALTISEPSTLSNLTHRSLSVVLPAYDEEGAITRTVHSFIETLVPWVPKFEIIIVNDGSTDRTQTIGAELASADTRVRLLTHPTNQGYGAALVSGFEAAANDLVFFTDIDGQFDPRDLAPFFELIEQYDAVLGYRIDRHDTWLRKLNAWGWHLLVMLIFGIQVRDVDCAFKLYHRSFLIQNPLETRGAMINAEMLYKLKRSNCTYAQLGVRHLPRTSGKATGANIAVILRALREMLLYAWKWRREELEQRKVHHGKEAAL